MDCIRAQELVSQAMDREPVDAALLAEAKRHCTACPECAAFVATLLNVRRAPLPVPRDTLVDDIMATVRAERARAERASASLAAARSARAQSEPAISIERDAALAGAPKSFGQRLLDPRNRIPLLAWSSAAAVALVAAGFGAVYGTRAILDDGQERMIVMESASTPAESEDMVFGNATAPQAAGDSASQEAYSAQSGQERSAVGLIVVDGAVYRSAGPDTSVTKESLSPRGGARTALAPGGIVSDREVLGTEDPARVFITADDGSFLAFDRVTMSFEGRTYVLQSGPVGEWGSPAVLPPAITPPATEDGRPTFDAVPGTSNPAIYVLRGQNAASGIALPPGARADVATGWSWWLPAAQ